MSSTTQSSSDFVRRVFSPIVGSLCSPAAESICQKNNLSFTEIIRPFCSVDLDLPIRDPSGVDHTIKKLQLQIQDVNERPPQPVLARKFLNESVSNSSCDRNIEITSGHITVQTPAEVKWYYAWCDTFFQVQFPSDHEFTKHLLGCVLVTSTMDPPETLQNLLQSLQQMQATAPARLPKWFSTTILKYFVLLHDKKDGNTENALKFFESLKTAYGSDHCFFLEVNSQTTQDTSSKLPDFWSQYLTNHRVDLEGSDHGSSPHTPAELGNITGMPSSLVSDGERMISSGTLEVAQEAGESSTPVILHPLSPDMEVNHFGEDKKSNNVGTQKIVNTNVWLGQNSSLQRGSYLLQSDVDNIKSMIKHFCSRTLIPHIEKQILLLSDLIANKKAMSRSIFNATKRLFGAPKPGQQGAAPVNSVIYTFDAPELQLRRLGDLCFMFTLYSSAFQAYHSAKRDFLADQAWLYYAGALEMAALSAYMQGGEISKKTLEYMDDAIVTYLNTKMPQFATRATILSTQCMKDSEHFGEAAKQYIRMTSEDSDLRSALLLEQASYCFLKSTRTKMGRKYAFHMVLAGHRYSKAGQKRHALRCYKQAYQVYQDRGWSLAEDHIHYTIGRLAGTLKLLSEGAESVAYLLSSGHPQTQHQQSLYLRDYLHLQEQSSIEETKGSLPILPIPIVEDNSACVLINAQSATEEAFIADSPVDNIRWSKMEELALSEAQGPPLIFKPTSYLFCKETINSNSPSVVVNESVFVQISLRNPTHLTLPLSNVRLLWQFHSADGKIIHNEETTTVSESLVQTNVTEILNLEPCSTCKVILKLVPLCSGSLHITGLYYVLSCLNNAPSDSQAPPQPSIPGKQNLTVRGPRLKPKADQHNTSNTNLYAEDFRLQINVLKSLPLLQLDFPKLKSYWLCGEMEQFNLSLKNIGNAPLHTLYMATSTPHLIAMLEANIEKKKFVKDANFDSLSPDNHTVGILVSKIKLQALQAGESINLPFWFRAPDKQGTTQLEVLFLYESKTADVSQRYRLVCHKSQFQVYGSIQMSAIANRSAKSPMNESVNISLTVKNTNRIYDVVPTEISLVQMSLVSSKWTLPKNVVHYKDLQLQTAESSMMFLSVVHVKDNANKTSDVCLTTEDIPSINSHPFYRFSEWHILCHNENTELDLVLCARWQADVTYSDTVKDKVIGQSHLSLKKLGESYTWPLDPAESNLLSHYSGPLKIFGSDRNVLDKKVENSISLENAIVYALEHEGTILHDFSQNRICTSQVKLVLKNRTEEILRVNVSQPPKQSNTSKTHYSPQSSSSFSWICRTHANVTIEPLETTIIQLTGAFVNPGTYELGSQLLVSATQVHSNKPPVSQICKVQSAIIIASTPS